MRKNILGFAFISQAAKVEIINVLVIIFIWAIMVILVNPIGDFPLNDDWAYGRAVKSFVEKGNFRLSNWTATNLFSQVFWGALFCLPFGFSFTLLRFSTLTLGLIGVIATYGLLRELNLKNKISLFGALLVAVNPIYFELSNTFMTDVPFFAFATLSFYFLLRYIKHASKFELVIGIIIAFIAILNRQLGLAIIIAFGCAYLLKKGINTKNFIKGFSPTFIGVIIQLSYQNWLHFTMRLPAMYGNQAHMFSNQVHMLFHGSPNEAGSVILIFAKTTLFSLVYLGLFIFPFLVILFPFKIKNFSYLKKNLTFFASSLFFVVVMKMFLVQNKLMPLSGNILVDFGLGPVGLINTYLPKAPKMFWIGITAIGVVGAALLLQYLFFAIGQIFSEHPVSGYVEKKWLITLIISAIFLYFFPIGFLGNSGFYDRYLIFLLPLLMMTISVSTTNISNFNFDYRAISIALIMMLLYGAFTIGATHDYLSWNRARWQALHNLMQEVQILPYKVEGGFEFFGWYLYDSKYKDQLGKDWLLIDKPDYIISFKPITGYKEVKRYPFKKWVAFGKDNILVLKKSTL